MNSAELRRMRKAMAEQRAELASLRAENRLLRAEVARRAKNEPRDSHDDKCVIVALVVSRCEH